MNKVSIITPCYNAEKYINETYQCLRSQTHENWEWIVFDDLSSDKSLSLLESLAIKDFRVKVFKNIKNSGAATTRNNCLDQADGEYIAFLDVDDLWMPSKLQLQIQFMKENKALFSHHDYQTINANGEFIKLHKTPKNVEQADLLKFNPFATSSIMINRVLIEENSIRFKEHLRRRQDYIFWFETIGLSKKSQGLDKNLSSYRIFGGDSLSANKKKMAIIQWKLYRKEFKLGLIPSVYYFFCYAVHGIRKYLIS